MNELDICENNMQAYKCIHIIENGLREFIIEEMTLKYGERWYKSHLPSNVLKTYKEGRLYEKNIKWNELIPHHPIYYIDFPNIKEIIERKDNWNEVFKETFHRSDIICTSLSEIEYIRNKVAHNRKISKKELILLESVYLKVESFIGENNLKRFALKCTAISNIIDKLSELRKNMKELFEICIDCKPILQLNNNFEDILKSWWFDESYINCKVDGIIEFYQLIKKYNQLNRHRGDGYKVEEWIKINDLIEIYNNAEKEFTEILKGSEL